MAQTSKVTTDHDEIRRWAEKHGGHPARVKGTGRRNDPGILRIDFPGFSGEGKLEPIKWDAFFRWFDANELALLCRPQDRFNKLISREGTKERAAGRRRAASTRPRAKAAARSRTGAAGGRKRTTGTVKRGARKQPARSTTSSSRKRPRAR
jgi:hypothetical protein